MFEGDPERKYVGPYKYVKHPPKALPIPEKLSDEEREMLGILRSIWEVPTRTEEFTRSWKDRLRKEWPELYNTISPLMRHFREDEKRG